MIIKIHISNVLGVQKKFSLSKSNFYVFSSLFYVFMSMLNYPEQPSWAQGETDIFFVKLGLQ